MSGNLSRHGARRRDRGRRDLDTVIVAFADAQGRLIGKRVSARFFQEEVLPHGAEACNYLLGRRRYEHRRRLCDVELGDRIRRHDAGCPTPKTLRRIPWLPGTATGHGRPRMGGRGHRCTGPPREILKGQRARLAERGLVAFSGTELEFIVFDNTYRDAWSRGYRGLTPSTDYNVDYDLLASGRLEPLLLTSWFSTDGAGMYCEGVKGECNFGQQEIAFRYAEVLETADQHAIYKNGAKAIAEQHGKALTFMAKFNEREGNSCHIHLSVRGDSGAAVMAGDGEHGFSPLMGHWIAGILATLREFTLLYAPTINSYKRYAEGSVRADGHRVGHRQSHLRASGRRPRLRRCGSRTACRGAMSTRTSASRPSSRVVCTASRTSWSCPSRSPAMPTPRASSSCPRRCVKSGAVRGVVDRPCGLRRRHGRSLSQPGAHRDRGVRFRRDGLGAGAWFRTTLKNAPSPPVAR